MPFQSDSQRKLCYLLKGKGQEGSWDCSEWSVATGKKKLPEHIGDLKEEGMDKKSEINSLINKWAGMSGEAVDSVFLKRSDRFNSYESGKGKYAPAPLGGQPLTVGAPPVGATPPLTGGTPPLTGGTPPLTGGTPPLTPAASPNAAGAPPNTGGVMNYASGAWDSAKSMASGAMGSVKATPAYNNASLAYQHRGAIAPTAWNAVQAGFGSEDAYTKLKEDSNRFNWSEARDKFPAWKDKVMADTTATFNSPTVQKGWQDLQKNMQKTYAGSLTTGQQAKLSKDYRLSSLEKAQAWGGGYIGMGKGPGYDRIVAGEKAKMTRSMGDIGTWLSNTGNSIVNNPVSKAIGTGVTNYATNSEAKRMTAQTAMPYVDWMRANPWAKYVGGGLALGAGAYGLHSLFGGGGANGGEEGEEEGNVMSRSFDRGLNPAVAVRRQRGYAG